jgi:hypothetical protein
VRFCMLTSEAEPEAPLVGVLYDRRQQLYLLIM